MTATTSDTEGAAAARAPAGGISRALVEAGVLTTKQLAYAERVHAKLGVERPLLALLRELFPITDADVRNAVRRKGGALRLGELLLELGYLRAEFLELALTIQREDPTAHRRVGQILVEHHLIDEHKLVEALAMHLGFPLVVPTADPIDAALFDALPLDVCEKYAMTPLRLEPDGVVVAFSDPTDREALAAADEAFGAERVLPAIADRSSIRAALARMDGRSEPTALGAAPPPAIVDLLDELLEDAVESGASAIHLEPRADGVLVRQREAGVLVARNPLPLSLAPALRNHLHCLCRTLDAARAPENASFLHQRGERSMSVSVASCPTPHGERIVLRIADASDACPALESLGLRPATAARLRADLADAVSGLWLVVGALGAGRSTTFRSLVASLVQPANAIALIEDAPLRPLAGTLQVGVDREHPFRAQLAAALGQDPDVVGIDELSDDASVQAAVSLAASGRRVIAVMGAEDATHALIALASRGVDRPLLASSLGGVLAQRLLRRVCEGCAQPDGSRVARQLAERLGAEDAGFRAGRGCTECRGSGLRGSVAVFEYLAPDAQQRWLLARGCSAPELARGAAAAEGSSFFEEAVARAAAGEVSAAEVARVKRVPDAPLSLASILERTGT